MFLTSLISIRRTDNRSFWPVFMAVFMSSCNRTNNDIVAPDRITGAWPPVARTGGACYRPQVRYPIYSPVGLHVWPWRVCNRAIEARRGGRIGTAFDIREGTKAVRHCSSRAARAVGWMTGDSYLFSGRFCCKRAALAASSAGGYSIMVDHQNEVEG